jgi:hypothetical protein
MKEVQLDKDDGSDDEFEQVMSICSFGALVGESLSHANGNRIFGCRFRGPSGFTV